jgi:hypothetical protein
MCTLDELANANLGVEVAAADAAVELLALAVGGVLVVEVAGVLHGDVVTLLGLVGAVAGRDQLLGDTHVNCCACEGSGVDLGDGCWERGCKSGAREEAEGHFSSELRFVGCTGPGTQRRGRCVLSGAFLGLLFRTDSYTKRHDGYEPRG